MFDQEELRDGVTLRVNRFQSPNDGKLYASLILRIKGKKTPEAHAIFQPLLKARKDMAKLKVELLEEAMKKKLEARKEAGLDMNSEPDAEMQQMNREHNVWLSRYGNPLFDYPDEEAASLINELTEKLRQAGFKKPKATHTSNGEIDEEVLHYAERWF